MMYLLFLGLLYKLQGGRFRSFVRAVMGYDVEADMTPTSPTTSGQGATTIKKARAAASGRPTDPHTTSCDEPNPTHARLKSSPGFQSDAA